ncbi:hypothetical protein DFH27DRAFT_280793 [Peziza echinospora]|nr:hypothetical protein DFH27DRAFT_280793 [Peziza echinospora]
METLYTISAILWLYNRSDGLPHFLLLLSIHHCLLLFVGSIVNYLHLLTITPRDEWPDYNDYLEAYLEQHRRSSLDKLIHHLDYLRTYLEQHRPSFDKWRHHIAYTYLGHLVTPPEERVPLAPGEISEIETDFKSRCEEYFSEPGSKSAISVLDLDTHKFRPITKYSYLEVKKYFSGYYDRDLDHVNPTLYRNYGEMSLDKLRIILIYRSEETGKFAISAALMKLIWSYLGSSKEVWENFCTSAEGFEDSKKVLEDGAYEPRIYETSEDGHTTEVFYRVNHPPPGNGPRRVMSVYHNSKIHSLKTRDRETIIIFDPVDSLIEWVRNDGQHQLPMRVLDIHRAIIESIYSGWKDVFRKYKTKINIPNELLYDFHKIVSVTARLTPTTTSDLFQDASELQAFIKDLDNLCPTEIQPIWEIVYFAKALSSRYEAISYHYDGTTYRYTTGMPIQELKIQENERFTKDMFSYMFAMRHVLTIRGNLKRMQEEKESTVVPVTETEGDKTECTENTPKDLVHI